MKCVQWILCLLCCVGLWGCDWGKPSRPSVLVIAVDSLGLDQVRCAARENSAKESGFNTLCAEAVHFTHAYTPSLMSQSALASILTAQYPFENGVRHNGAVPLSGKAETLAEKAIKNAYRTSFISGGPPIWSYSGLSQGFEVFLDNYKISSQRLFSPFFESVDRFIKWQSSLSASTPFFSLIYVPDLQFSKTETKDNFDDTRPANYGSQIKELEESLYSLFQKMKKKNIWNSTYVVLVGLNGRVPPEEGLAIRGLSLKSLNTEVALMIKPARKKRDLGLNWKVDQNISLVDLGKTLDEIVTQENETRKGERNFNDTLQPLKLSFLPALKEPTDSWNQERSIIVETHWPLWMGLGGPRYSARWGHFLFIYDEEPKIYNTYIDHFEATAFPEESKVQKNKMQQLKDFFVKQKMKPWEGIDKGKFEKTSLAEELWGNEGISFADWISLEKLYEQYPEDEEIKSWRAEGFMQKKLWKSFKKISKGNLRWSFFAKKALGENIKSKTFLRDGCLSSLVDYKEKRKTINPKECEDREFVHLVYWLRNRGKKREYEFRQKFMRYYRRSYLDQEISRNNDLNNHVWGLTKSKLDILSLTDMTLYLPQFQTEKSIVEKLLQ